MKGLIRGLAIGLALVAVLVSVGFYLNYQREKNIKQLSKKFSAEKLLKMVEQQEIPDCKRIVSELKNKNKC